MDRYTRDSSSKIRNQAREESFLKMESTTLVSLYEMKSGEMESTFMKMDLLSKESSSMMEFMERQ